MKDRCNNVLLYFDGLGWVVMVESLGGVKYGKLSSISFHLNVTSEMVCAVLD